MISAHGEVVRSLMISAHSRGLTSGEFVFFCFMPYSQDEMFGSFEWKQGAVLINININLAWWCKSTKLFSIEIFLYLGDEYDLVAKQAYQALFILSMFKPDDERYRGFAEDVIKRSKQDFGYTYEPHEKVSLGAEKLVKYSVRQHNLVEQTCPGPI